MHNPKYVFDLIDSQAYKEGNVWPNTPLTMEHKLHFRKV